MHGLHLLRPPGRRLKLLHRPHLVHTKPGNPDAVVALQHDLDVSDVQGLRGSQLGEAARGGDNGVDEVVGLEYTSVDSLGEVVRVNLRA
jgi:hypothetical protein